MEGVKSNSVVYRQDHIKQRVAAEPFALFCGEVRSFEAESWKWVAICAEEINRFLLTDAV